MNLNSSNFFRMFLKLGWESFVFVVVAATATTTTTTTTTTTSEFKKANLDTF